MSAHCLLRNTVWKTLPIFSSGRIMNKSLILDKINSSLSIHLMFLSYTYLQDIYPVCDSVTQFTDSCFLLKKTILPVCSILFLSDKWFVIYWQTLNKVLSRCWTREYKCLWTERIRALKWRYKYSVFEFCWRFEWTSLDREIWWGGEKEHLDTVLHKIFSAVFLKIFERPRKQKLIRLCT